MALREKMQQPTLESMCCHQFQCPVNPDPAQHQTQNLSLRMTPPLEQLKIGHYKLEIDNLGNYSY